MSTSPLVVLGVSSALAGLLLLAGASHDGRLWVGTVTTGELLEIDRTDNGDITGLAFAPDSRWLAWSPTPGPGTYVSCRT